MQLVKANVQYGLDEYLVMKYGKARPTLTRAHCGHGGGVCPSGLPVTLELPAVPVQIATVRVLKAMALDELDACERSAPAGDGAA